MTTTHYADFDKNRWSSEAEQINTVVFKRPYLEGLTWRIVLLHKKGISLIFAFYCKIVFGGLSDL